MKVILACVLALIVTVLAEDPLVLDPYMIQKINSRNDVDWVAGENEVFKGKRLSEVIPMLGAFLPRDETDHTPREEATGVSVPSHFDSYSHWSHCAHHVRNQEPDPIQSPHSSSTAQCGSCWAFSASEALTDRYCIKKNNRNFPVLSPQDMVSCDHGNHACRGGLLGATWNYLEHTGIVSDQCMPYKSGSGHVPSCPHKCANPSHNFHKYKAKNAKHFRGAAAAKESIMKHGPIQAAFMVYQDFFSYKSGVYHHVSGGLSGGHAVLITGWGVTSSGTKYWIVKNSWGPSFGMKGFFWIEESACKILDQLWAGEAI